MVAHRENAESRSVCSPEFRDAVIHAVDRPDISVGIDNSAALIAPSRPGLRRLAPDDAAIGPQLGGAERVCAADGAAGGAEENVPAGLRGDA